MAPEILDGETLGEKHRYYNKLIKQLSSEDSSQETQKTKYDEPDINNLYKIDIAANKKNVEYIVEILKCEDMLYVSRALKQSLWLITDKEYAHIINPSYLYSQLLPKMTSKAGHKLILRIRLNLKDEKRVEEFYNYYEQKNELETAFKWLPNCSSIFIENVVEKNAEKIPKKLIRILCERSFTILDISVRKVRYDSKKLLSNAAFLLNNNYAEQYVNILTDNDPYYIPDFNAKYTQLIIKKFPDMVINNFEKFAEKIDIPTFAKSLRQEDIKNFLIKQNQNKNLRIWFTFENIKHFIERIPIEGRFDFIKHIICIEKTREENAEYDDDAGFSCQEMCLKSANFPQSSNENIYRWYRFAPFVTAFTELKQLIRIESNASERNAMLAILMICARKNLQNVQTLLQYYRDKHINEPFKFKSHFINIVLSNSNTHKFDEKTWGILNDIFCSMEVYSENVNNVQSCLRHIIVRSVVNGLEVPEIVEKKFEFDSFKTFQSKLNTEEKDKVFNYLYQHIITKIQNNPVATQTDFRELKYEIKNILIFLVNWNKDLLDYGIVLEKIRELTQINVNKTWNEDLFDIYNVKKSWRKYMFKESLLLQPTQETYINALKHMPNIFDLYKEQIYQNDYKPLNNFLNKVRIYWPLSLAKTFEDSFRNQLDDKTKHKLSVQGLCLLLPQKEIIEIIAKYRPDDTKINWGKTDELTLSIQKNLAKYMYLARPQPPVELLLLYARGDYLQYTLPSLHSILYHINIDRSIEHVPKFLDAPVSLQKHGFKFAFSKLKTDVLLKTCHSTWKSNNNASIRATIFKLIFNLLCKQQNETIIQEVWSVLSMLMDTLTSNENKIIHAALKNAKKVPIPVREAYCIKTYRYLKSLPPKANCNGIIDAVINGIFDIIESIDTEFIAEVINDSLDVTCEKEYFRLTKLTSTCLLSVKSETVQKQRYELIFLPLFKKYLSILKGAEDKIHLKINFIDILENLHSNFPDIPLEKNVIIPTKLYNDIYCDLKENISVEDNYVLIMTWKLAVEYMKIFDKYKEDVIEIQKDVSKWITIYSKIANKFGKLCIEQLKEQISQYFPSIHTLFAKALEAICTSLRFRDEIILSICKAILIHDDIIEGHLLVIDIMPKQLYGEDKEERSKLYEILDSHQSVEVKIHFQQLLRDAERF